MDIPTDEPVHRVQTGDTVIYSKYAGTEVALEGADYVLLKVTRICKVVVSMLPHVGAPSHRSSGVTDAGGRCHWRLDVEGVERPVAAGRPCSYRGARLQHSSLFPHAAKSPATQLADRLLWMPSRLQRRKTRRLEGCC